MSSGPTNYRDMNRDVTNLSWMRSAPAAPRYTPPVTAAIEPEAAPRTTRQQNRTRQQPTPPRAEPPRAPTRQNGGVTDLSWMRATPEAPPLPVTAAIEPGSEPPARTAAATPVRQQPQQVADVTDLSWMRAQPEAPKVAVARVAIQPT